MNHYLEEFCRTTEELLGSDAVRMMGRWKHHGHISTLDHSLFVAYCSYRAARALRLDETADALAIARARQVEKPGWAAAHRAKKARK